ncbi:transcriptional regulator [Amycolatopsis cynarae]|uniref:Transcriptional regulator n=1 Tax=Amycolatopsis cynarae TaxID=2995223 RepID=A0ABY7AWB7_9PSEU|nr:transcriptional regulator [Amycolatopsis sp. HUAS 11-8]WAL64294.1 transcriptional regulator [Amycolatopsis sp. HUAS 11-8]
MAANVSRSIKAIAALEDGLRARMYGYIRAARRPVTRDEAAAFAGISRKLAAFHLDKLVGVGLLRAGYEQLGGVRRVGRRPKVYRCTDLHVRVEIPVRSHDLLTAVLLDAVLDAREEECSRDAALRAARAHGARLAVRCAGAADPLGAAEKVLADHGFEPYRPEPGCLRLHNCPFRPLTERAPELVCGLNHALLTGFGDATGVRAVFGPHAGECCVELRSQASLA